MAAPGGLLGAPLLLSAGPPNGGLTDGLAGWDVEGRDTPPLLAPGARLVGNTTIVSPPLLVPVGAQSLAVTLASPGGDGLLVVSARPVEGGPAVELATLEPSIARRSWAVGVEAIAGRQVRIVLDPVPALGTVIDMFGIGPVTAPLPGWSIRSGDLDRRGAPARGSLAVSDRPLRLSSPSFALGPGARELLVAVRGDGVVSGSAGRGGAAIRATTTWSDLHVPVRGASGALALVATPGVGGLEMRDSASCDVRSPSG